MEKETSRQTKKKERYKYVGTAVTLVLMLGVSIGYMMKDGSSFGGDPLFRGAVADAITAEPEEICPLVELTDKDSLTTWDSEGRVLLLSWHKKPERYPEREEIILTEGSVWTFTDKEIALWYDDNSQGVSDWNQRLEQLIGLPPESGYTHVSAFWVKPENVVRPAFVTDVTEQMQLTFPEGTDAAFQEWFEENRVYSYEIEAYPWTRLGYTYDWADNGTEYGLTEFLIEQDAPVKVEFTKTTEEFLAWLENNQ